MEVSITTGLLAVQPVTGSLTTTAESTPSGGNYIGAVGVATHIAWDGANTAVRVNVVAGGAGGGVAQLQTRNLADTAWVNVGIGEESGSILHVPVRIQGTGTNLVGVVSATPTGAEYGLIVRPLGNVAVTGILASTQQERWIVDVSNPVLARQFGNFVVGVTNTVASTQSGTWTTVVSHPVASHTLLNA